MCRYVPARYSVAQMSHGSVITLRILWGPCQSWPVPSDDDGERTWWPRHHDATPCFLFNFKLWGTGTTKFWTHEQSKTALPNKNHRYNKKSEFLCKPILKEELSLIWSVIPFRDSRKKYENIFNPFLWFFLDPARYEHHQADPIFGQECAGPHLVPRGARSPTSS